MTRGVQVTYLYHDYDVIELQIAADNGRFRGTTRVYAGIGELSDVAESLKASPLAYRRDLLEIILPKLEKAGLAWVNSPITDLQAFLQLVYSGQAVFHRRLRVNGDLDVNG